MAFLGNSSSSANFVPQVDYFSGDGSTVAFTLSRPVASVYQVEAVVANVVQNPSDAYTVNGNVITFTSAPPAGTNNVYVRFAALNSSLIQPGQGTVFPANMSGGAPYWDSNGNVGIGTVLPASALHVHRFANVGAVGPGVTVRNSNPQSNNTGLTLTGASGYGLVVYTDSGAVGGGDVNIAANMSGGDIRFLTGGFNERIRIPADAGGIKFPAIQAASSNPNTLDDYEEGAWSPTFSFTVSGDASNCTYTKIGRLVTLTFYIQGARTNSPAGDFNMGGLPFSIAVGPDCGAGNALPYNVSTPGTLVSWRRYGDNSIGLLSSSAGTTWSWTQNGAFSTGLFAVAGQFSYLTA